jgi:hypothetical protein
MSYFHLLEDLEFIEKNYQDLKDKDEIIEKLKNIKTKYD